VVCSACLYCAYLKGLLHSSKHVGDGGTTFGISHYAGHVSTNFLSNAVCSTRLLSIALLQVQYDMTGFLDKNRDTLPSPIVFLMKGETDHFIYTVTVNLACCYEV